MGAVHKLDLTSDVTHLIVGNSNTAKYRYVARERPDVVVLKLDWIEAVRALWILGEDIDPRALEEQYRRPVFADLQISLTGFDDCACHRSVHTCRCCFEDVLIAVYSGATAAPAKADHGKRG